MGNPFKISLRGYVFEDAQLPFNLASGIDNTKIGYAVTLDTSAPNQVKLAGNNDRVIGRLQSVENRSLEGVNVGTVACSFADTLPIATGATFNLGDTCVGFGANTGTVAPRFLSGSDAPDWDDNYVVEINTTAAVPYVVVVKI